MSERSAFLLAMTVEYSKAMVSDRRMDPSPMAQDDLPILFLASKQVDLLPGFHISLQGKQLS